MREKIKDLEDIARRLDPTSSVRSEWLSEVHQYSENFLEDLQQGKAYRTDGSPHMVDRQHFSEQGRPLSELLELLKTGVDTQGINPASGGHLGYIPGGGIYPAALGDYMADVTNRYAGIYFANPGAVKVENKLIRWMCDLIGYPSNAIGNLASGGSVANLIGITCARDAKGITSKHVPESVIYINPQTHHCVHKAIRIAGLAECQVREVPLDDRFRMQPEVLRQMIAQDVLDGLKPFLVVASLGSTDTGAVDPIDALADIAEEFDLWFQIDAAYGGFFAMVPELASKFKGVNRADSFIIDPHKGLFLPYGLGVILVKDSKQIVKSHYYQANYMQDAYENTTEISPADVSPELTKHFRGLRMWLPLQLLGTEPFRAALKEKWLLAKYFYGRIKEIGFEVGPEPELSVVIYRYVQTNIDANRFNKELTSAVQKDGRIFVSSTLINGVFWIRLAVLSFRTHLHEVDLLVDILERERDRLLLELRAEE